MNRRLRFAFMGNPGYGGVVLEALLANNVEVVAVFHASQSKLHHLKKVYRRYLRSRQRVKEGVRRLSAKMRSFADQRLPVPQFGKDVLEVAQTHGLRVFDGSFAHHRRCPEALRALDVDVILVATFGEFLPRAVLDAPKLAAINMHPSLLPQYRGGFPEFSVILHGQNSTGVTYHLMEEKFDTGNILLQRELRIDEGETTLTLKSRLARLASEAVPELLHLVEHDNLTGTPQASSNVSYCRLNRDFDRIASSLSRQQIRNLINACYDVEAIGEPRFSRNGRDIFALSYGPDGLPFHASDGVITFDVVRYRHKIYRGRDLSRLYPMVDS